MLHTLYSRCSLAAQRSSSGKWLRYFTLLPTRFTKISANFYFIHMNFASSGRGWNTAKSVEILFREQYNSWKFGHDEEANTKSTLGDMPNHENPEFESNKVFKELEHYNIRPCHMNRYLPLPIKQHLKLPLAYEVPTNVNQGKGKLLPWCSVPCYLTSSLRFVNTSSAKLGPKAKSKGARGLPDSSGANVPGGDHVFNIYSQIEKDHDLLPDKFYPDWLWSLSKKKKSYGELAMIFIHGKGIEDATFEEYQRFRRLHNKNLIKLNNMRLKKSKRSSMKQLFTDV